MTNLRQMVDDGTVQAYGTPEGAEKGWDSRGRGRKLPPGGTVAQSKAHNVLTKLGFDFTGKERSGPQYKASPYDKNTYSHPSYGKVHVYATGHWDHRGYNEGDGASELRDYLSDFKDQYDRNEELENP